MSVHVQPVRIYLLATHETERQLWTDQIDAAEDLRVVGDSGSALRSLSLVAQLSPDVAILSLDLPDGSGLAACRSMLTVLPDLAVLIVTAQSDDRSRADAYRAGARGCVRFAARDDLLVSAVQHIARGGSLFGDAGPMRRADAAGPAAPSALQEGFHSIPGRPWPA